MSQQQQANPTASTRRGARAVKSALRVARNVLALLGVFFVYLLWHGYSAYEAEMAASSQDVACVKSSRCM
ncbi:hypothetical protein [Paraburkholderia largidicola]|uniref:Uncharacterized protein n=1 Tax=Paraburkholderia largidicola TaxID=3014751 RepID=A0A7I8BKN4_9BURK|nr:hypothetical protein [Paraburkholderia sp. PGU16]BCF88710.1 hypothetical protein PPGU16_17770 [Paraburkholderia sp. PGU16]